MKLVVERIKLSKDGYSSTGKYFGVGAPLYAVSGHTFKENHELGGYDIVYEYVRAANAKEAREIVKAKLAK